MGYKQSRERNRRLKKVYMQTKNTYGSGVWYNEKKGRYIRYYPRGNTSLSRYFRKQANRKVRRNKHEPLQHGSYRKVYDYRWNLF